MHAKIAKGIKMSLRRCAAFLVAVCVTAGAAAPQTVQAVELIKDKDGSQYAQDTNGFVYFVPKGATTAKGCTIYMYGGTKSSITFPSKCNSYTVTNIGSNFSQLIMTKLQTVKIPSGYTTIEANAFQNQTDLYRIEIPASVKTIGKNAFNGCDKNKLTIVAPFGSAAEKYAAANGIHWSYSTALQIRYGYSKMYVGEAKQIAVLNNAQKITWKSTNSAVASVNANGVVTAKKAGSVKVTATIGTRTYTYPFTIVSRTQNNVLDVVWNGYVTAGMSDYEKAVAAQQWMEKYVSPSGTSVLAKKAFEQGKASYKGFCEAYKTILAHYGISATVVNGTKHMENSVVIAGKKYTASTLTSASGVDKNYTTTTIKGVVLNKSTMTLSVGKTGTFKVTGTTQKATWSTGNSKIATVNKNGKVTAKGAGLTTVTMKVNGKSYTCTVRVNA